MPQFDPSSWISQIFWLIVTFGFLYFLMARVALPRMSEILEARGKKISGDLERAERLKEEAEKVLADYEKAIADARSSATQTLSDANKEIAAVSAKRRSEFDTALQRRAEAAEESIERARNEALGFLDGIACEVARAATNKLLSAEVADAKLSKAVNEALGKRG